MYSEILLFNQVNLTSYNLRVVRYDKSLFSQKIVALKCRNKQRQAARCVGVRPTQLCPTLAKKKKPLVPRVTLRLFEPDLYSGSGVYENEAFLPFLGGLIYFVGHNFFRLTRIIAKHRNRMSPISSAVNKIQNKEGELGVQ